MSESMQHKKAGLYVEVKKDIESRLQLLNLWKKSIRTQFDLILSKNPIDEIKDLILQIDEAISKNIKLRDAIYIEENQDLNDRARGQLNSLILNSLGVLNDNSERDLETLKTAMSYIGIKITYEGLSFFRKAV
ncbi:hypothetical protein [Maribacter flavus]